jgi:ATP dependent DNA ligase domain
MTELVPQLSALPITATLDGELVAFGGDGAPDFPLLCERMLMRRTGIPVTYTVFDLLSHDGENLMAAPYSERRGRLEALDLNGLYWTTPETFDDGEALFEAVCEHGLEGILCKRRSGCHRPGPARLDQDEVKDVLALGDGTGVRAQQAAGQAVRLVSTCAFEFPARPRDISRSAPILSVRLPGGSPD